MTPKQEALDRAKEQGKKAVEWWKQFWRWSWQAIKWTTLAVWHTLWTWYEAWASKISEFKENEEWISEGKKKEYRTAKKQHSDKAKDHIQKAKSNVKKAGAWAKEAIKWWGKAIAHGAAAWYHVVDAWDKAIWEKIEKEQLKKWKKVWKVSSFFRDNILKLLIAWWLVWYWWTEVAQHVREWKEAQREIQHNEQWIWDSNEIMLVSITQYDILNWKKITTNAPLTRRYLWWDLENSWDLIVWDILTLNSAESLHNLWSEKIRKYWQSTNDISKLDSIDTSNMSSEEIENFRIKYPIDATYLFVVKPYTDWNEKKETISLQDFIKQTNKIVEDTRNLTEAYDWWLTWVKKDLFDAIRNDIAWECIVAYAMTELCENKENWEFNKQLFDLLLQNAWVNYLSKVPAIYDWKTSYWLYQFTEYALHDTGNDVRWASIVNKVLPKESKIPWSVIDLVSRQEQSKAAYMFAIQNLSTAVKKLTDQQAEDLLKYQRSHKEDFRDNITQLIGMCHHLPVDAKALKKWHEDKYKSAIYKYGKAQTYGKASKNNYEALKKH